MRNGLEIKIRSLRDYLYGGIQRFYRHNKSGWLIEDSRPLFLKLIMWLEMSELVKMIDEYICEPWKDTGQHFHTYFDWSQGILIDSHEKALAVEKETGYKRVTVQEWQAESKRQRKFIDEEHERHIEKKLHGIMHDIAQGRKFSQEVYAHREKVMKENGMTRLPGRAR
jgi:hypothetical protein